VPELPEVETIRRQLEPKLIDAAIVDAASICCSTSTRAPTVDHRGNWSSISG